MHPGFVSKYRRCSPYIFFPTLLFSMHAFLVLEELRVYNFCCIMLGVSDHQAEAFGQSDPIRILLELL